MKSKAKSYCFLGLALLLVSLVVGCARSYPTVTAEQVISRVQVYGVPTIPSHYGSAPNPVGQWAAVYEGENTWRVRGAIVTRYEGKDYYYSTTWTHNNTEVRLVSIIGEPPQPKTTPSGNGSPWPFK